LNKNRYIILLSLATILVVLYIWMSKESESSVETSEISKVQMDKQSVHNSTEIADSDVDFYNISVKKDDNKSSIEDTQDSLASIYFQQIRKLMLEKDPSLKYLDKVMSALLMDENVSRDEKIYGLWNLLNEIGFTSAKSEYLLDSLSTMMPIELTDKIFAIYEKLDNQKIKIKLIHMLADNLNIANPDKQTKSESDFIIQKSIDIQKFFKEHIVNNQDKTMFKEYLQAYIDISDERDTQDMLAKLKEDSSTLPINEVEFTDILVESSLSTSEAQEEMLPSMLENMQNVSPEQENQKQAFNKVLLESIDAGVLDEKSQETVAEYLKNEEPNLTPSSTINSSDISNYYQWAKASTKISSNGTDINKILSEEDNPLKVSAILIYADDDEIKNINSSGKTQEIHQKLETSLNKNHYPEGTVTIIRDAMKRIDEK